MSTVTVVGGGEPLAEVSDIATEWLQEGRTLLQAAVADGARHSERLCLEYLPVEADSASWARREMRNQYLWPVRPPYLGKVREEGEVKRYGSAGWGLAFGPRSSCQWLVYELRVGRTKPGRWSLEIALLDSPSELAKRLGLAPEEVWRALASKIAKGDDSRASRSGPCQKLQDWAIKSIVFLDLLQADRPENSGAALKARAA